MTEVRWLHEAVSAEGRRFRIGARAATRIAEWVDLLRVEVTSRGQVRVHCPNESLTSRKLRQGAVPALLGHLTGHLHWHAAACALPSAAGAVLFLGDAGAGKSTTVAGLGTVGAAFLGDDVVHLHRRRARWVAVRCENRHAIRADVARMLFGTDARTKSLFVPERKARSAPLAAIVELEVGDSLELRRLSKRRSVRVLLRHLVRFALDDLERIQRDLDVVLAILEEVPVYTLVRPKKLQDWARLASLLEAAARGVLDEAGDGEC